jgi:hypothetical protein
MERLILGVLMAFVSIALLDIADVASGYRQVTFFCNALCTM